MGSQFSFKELYDVRLTAPYDITIGDQTFVAGETLALFDKIIVANFNEIANYVSASGGYSNANFMTWQYTKELNFNFSQGIFNLEQLALLTNHKLINEEEESIWIHQREQVVADEDGQVILKYYPQCNKGYYVYDVSTGEKLTVSSTPTITEISGKFQVDLDLEDSQEVIIDYIFDYNRSSTKQVHTLQIGNPLLKGFLELEGRTKVQEDGSGIVKTAIIKIPRLQLMSNLSIRLGQTAQPVVGTFQAIAHPTGTRGNEKVMELLFLEDDIDSDM